MYKTPAAGAPHPVTLAVSVVAVTSKVMPVVTPVIATCVAELAAAGEHAPLAIVVLLDTVKVVLAI